MYERRLGSYRAGWTAGGPTLDGVELRTRVRSLSFLPVDIGGSKIVLGSGDQDGFVRAAVFGAEVSFKRDPVKAITSTEKLVFSSEVNDIACDWVKGGIVGCSDRREIKTLALLPDSHLTVNEDLGPLEKVGRATPVPKCVSYTASGAAIVVGHNRGGIMVMDPRGVSELELKFPNEDFNDVDASKVSEHVVASASKSGCVRVHDLRQPKIPTLNVGIFG